jgi:mRNA-degrading endonuclease RelE of RelBE toxin-antitoxin system
MRIEITPYFAKEAKRLSRKYPSFKSDLTEQLKSFADDPQQGESIGKSCYKVRMGITSKGKGKSGGSRIITCVRIHQNKMSLLTIYDKSEREDISDAELKILLRQVDDE